MVQLSSYARVNYDPTRTLTIRNAFARRMSAKFRALRILIRRAIVDQDVFGLKSDGLGLTAQQEMALPGRQAFAFPRSA